MQTNAQEAPEAAKQVEALRLELERCQYELSQCHGRLRQMEGLFAHVADSMLLTGPGGRIIDANPAASALLGYEKRELLNLHAWDFVTPASRHAILEQIRRTASGIAVTLQATCPCKSGEQKVLDLRFARFDAGGHDLMVLSFRDVTEAKRAEAFLAAEKRLLEMVAQGQSLSSILSALCEQFEKLYSGSVSSVLLADSRSDRLWHGAAPNISPKYTEAISGGVKIGPSEGSCGIAAYRGEPVFVSDIDADPLWRDYRNAALACGLRSCWSMPIFSTERKVLGTFATYFREPASPTQHQHDVIEQFAHLASIAIERAQGHEALRRSEAYLAEAQKLSLTGSFGWNTSSGELFWSDETFRILECDRATKPSLEFVFSRIHPDDITLVKQTLDRAKCEGTDLDFEHRLLMPDDAVKHVHIVAHALDDKPESKEFVGAVMDVTRHHQAEAALAEALSEIRKSEQDLRLMIDSIPGLVSSRTPEGEAEFINQQVLDFFGESVKGMPNWSTYLHPDDRERAVSLWHRSLETGQLFEGEFRARRDDGVYRWLHSRVNPLRDTEGRIVRWYNLLTDIDDRKRAEQAFRDSEQRFRLIVDNIPGFVCAMTAAGELELVNQRILNYTGKTLEELKNWGRLVHQDDLARVVNAWTRSVQTGCPYDIEHRILGADGAFRWFHVRGLPLRNVEGSVVRWYVALYDIEDRKRAEEAARASEHNFRLIFNSIAGLVTTHSASGELELANQPFLDYTGETVENLKDNHSILHPDDRDLVLTRWKKSMETGDPLRVEVRLRRADGIYRWFYACAIPLRSEDGRVIRWYSLFTDVDDHKKAGDALSKARSDLAHVSRITTVGELAASIAHEVNQPLAAVVTNANACLRWLDREVPNLDEAREAVRRIVRDGNLGSEVIGRIRALLKNEPPARVCVSVNETVEETLKLAQAELHGLVLQLELASELPQVIADRVQLQQVLLNLIMNALDAMRPVSDRPRVLRIETKSHGNDAVLVAVRDSGIGLQPESMEKLFQTFYTTKPRGLGMGLSISRSIIEAHGGRLWAECHDAPGATFQFVLPAGNGGVT